MSEEQNRRWSDQHEDRRSSGLNHRVDTLELAVQRIERNSELVAASIQGIATTLARMEERDEGHRREMDAVVGRMINIAKVVDDTTPKVAAVVERTDSHHRLIYGSVLTAIGSLVAALFAAIQK